jgi:hypothetical protein
LYTDAELEQAKFELARWNEKWENYSGNNPGKYQSDIKASARKVREIERHLKDTGVLKLTKKEKSDKELDCAFPNAQSKEVVEYKGGKYRGRFRPLEWSRSRKTVTAWGKGWESVED